MRFLVALVSAIILPTVAACGTDSQPTTDLSVLCARHNSDFFTSAPPIQQTVLVRQCDDLTHVYLVPRGWLIQVALTEQHESGSSDTWSTPQSSSSATLERIESQRFEAPDSSNKYLVATFRPVRQGSATITAVSTDCARGLLLQNSCSNSYMFRVRVQVI